MRAELRHTHLPALEDAGLIAWDRERGTVTTTTHPALDDHRFRSLLETAVDGLSAVLADIADDRRRLVIAVVRAEETPLSRTELARAVCRRETGEAAPDTDAVEAVSRALYHTHLPKLADDRVLEFDPAADEVVYHTHPGVEAVFSTLYAPRRRPDENDADCLDVLENAHSRIRNEPRKQTDWLRFWKEPRHE